MPGSSSVVPLGANRIKQRLKNFWQWSSLSPGHSTFEELIGSCVFEEDGTVNDPIMVTELTAHSYVLAAEIYLHCRVYR